MSTKPRTESFTLRDEVVINYDEQNKRSTDSSFGEAESRHSSWAASLRVSWPLGVENHTGVDVPSSARESGDAAGKEKHDTHGRSTASVGNMNIVNDNSQHQTTTNNVIFNINNITVFNGWISVWSHGVE